MPAGTQVASLFGVLSLDDKDFTRGVDGAEGKLKTLSGSITGMIGNVGKAVAIGATAIVGATAAIGAGMFELAKDAAPIQGIQKAFEGVAEASGQSADKMLKSLAQGSKGLVTNTELMKSYNSAAQLVSTEFANQLPEAMQYLSKVSAATGQDMGFMLDSLVKGVGRVSPMILDNLGIQVNATEAMEEYAKANGKAADQLSKTEQQAAIMAKTLQLLKKNTAAMPDITDNASTKWGQFQTRLANFKDEVGVKLLPFFDGVNTLLMKLADTVLPVVMPLFDRLGQALGVFFSGIANGFDPLDELGYVVARVFGIDISGAINIIHNITGFIQTLVTNVQAGIDPLTSFASAIMSGFGSSDLTRGIVNAILNIKDFIDNGVIPAVERFTSWLGAIWAQVQPGLQSLANWFTQDALPAVLGFINNSVIPGIQTFINILSGIWNSAQPTLQSLWLWFTQNGLPWINQAVNDFKVNYLDPFLNGLGKLWAEIKPKLDNLPQTFSEASKAAKDLVDLGLLAIFDTLNKAAASAGLLIGIVQIFFITALNNASLAAQGIVKDVQSWIDTNSELLKRLMDLGLTLVLVGLGIKVYTDVMALAAIATGLGAGLAGAVTAAGSALLGIGATMLATIIPLLALIGVVYTAIAAFHKLIDLRNEAIQAVKDQTANAAPGIKANNLSLQDVKDKAFAETAKQYGGGALGDLQARLLWGSGIVNMDQRVTDLYNGAQQINSGNPKTMIPQRAGGGGVMSGMPYIVGEQGPELFTPSVSGNISTASQTAGMMGGMHIDTIIIQADTYEGGQAAMRGLQDRARSMGYSFG